MREWGPSDYIAEREVWLKKVRLKNAWLKNKRLYQALGAYAILALLAYLTLDGPFRALVWFLCGGLTVMTLARAKYGEKDPQDGSQKAE